MQKEVEVFYDGDCRLCMKEISMMMRKDREQRITFTNIAAPSFDAGSYGKTYTEFMKKIQGRLPDGTWIEGVEVFRRLYAAIGFRKLAAVTRLPVLSQALHLGYVVFAKNRLRFTGRCLPDESGTAACAIPASSN
jgi:predicted DCC family thiol-disulfide oxidoreductase YuxK